MDILEQHKAVNETAAVEAYKAVNRIERKMESVEMQPSRFIAIKKLMNEVEKGYKQARIGLNRDLDNELGELYGNIITGNMEGIRGNLEALKCIHSQMVDLVGIM